jgi:two-component system, sensor histidine kinase and response regulator
MENKEVKGKILAVDDDDGVRRIIKYHLNKAGYVVQIAENGKFALELLRNETPDLIISDVSMPEMNGYELYKEISSKKEYKLIPFLFLTSRSDREDIMLAKKMGVDDYLTKPVDKDLLLISVEAKISRFKELKEDNKKVLEKKVNDMYRMLSHEINTPISIIQGFTDLTEMLLSAGKPRIEDLKGFLDGIKSGNERLKKLAESVLILNSIDGGYEMERYQSLSYHMVLELGDLIKGISENFKNILLERDVAIELNLPGEPLYVKGIGEHIKCILENIIDNGIKFVSKKSGKVFIRACKDGSVVKVEIEDNGAGIHETELDKIFDRYYQINRDRFEQQGLGIGLTIAKALTEINKIDLTVKSQLGKGSTFTLIFSDQ